MKNVSIMIFLICFVGILSISVQAQTYTAINNDTAQVTNTQNVSVSDLKKRLADLLAEKAKWNNNFDPQIADVQSQINQLALAGVETAVPLASQDVQDQITFDAAIAHPATVLDTQGTIKTP